MRRDVARAGGDFLVVALMLDRAVVIGMEKGTPEEATGSSTVVVLKLFKR